MPLPFEPFEFALNHTYGHRLRVGACVTPSDAYSFSRKWDLRITGEHTGVLVYPNGSEEQLDELQSRRDGVETLRRLAAEEEDDSVRGTMMSTAEQLEALPDPNDLEGACFLLASALSEIEFARSDDQHLCIDLSFLFADHAPDYVIATLCDSVSNTAPPSDEVVKALGQPERTHVTLTLFLEDEAAAGNLRTAVARRKYPAMTYLLSGGEPSDRLVEQSRALESAIRKVEQQWPSLADSVLALHDRLDNVVDLELDIRSHQEMTAQLLTEPGERRVESARRLLLAAVPAWDILEEATRHDVLQGELRYRSIVAGEDEPGTAPQSAVSFGRAVERERSRLDRPTLHGGDQLRRFMELRDKADHPNTFTLLDLERMRSILLGLGVASPGGLLYELAGIARRRLDRSGRTADRD